MKRLQLLLICIMTVMAGFADDIDLGIHPINGITYHLYSTKDLDLVYYDRADVLLPEDGGKYAGDIFLPDSVEYDGRAFEVYFIDNRAFVDCGELTSVSMKNKNGAYISNCPLLKKVEIREGMVRYDHAITYCPSLESIEYPSSLCKIGTVPVWCKNLKSISFKTPWQIVFLTSSMRHPSLFQPNSR